MSAKSYRVDRGNRTSPSRTTAMTAEGPPPDWQQQLRDAVRDVGELEQVLDLPEGSLDSGTRAGARFPLLVPRAFVSRMTKGDPLDPLLRQILPTRPEDLPAAGFGPDPLAERKLALEGSVSKYPGRTLLITTGACPVHCRYCFRREFPYAAQTAARGDWQPALAAIRETPGVSEVILSGGDPLCLGNTRLGRLIEGLEAIPGITTLRIHTRFPIVLPARVDRGLVELIGSTRLNTVVVVHANHPAEIDEAVSTAAKSLKLAADFVLNQSVLLRGVNDSAETLIRLSERLLDAGIVPYYLHLLDRVSGAAHFEIDERKAAGLIAAMRRQAPGYLVPRLVRDEPGRLSKTSIA